MNIVKLIRDKLAGVDEVVPVLVFFEMIYLAVGQLIIWAFLPVDKPAVALGFAIGVGFAVLSSIQNSMLLKGALARGKKKSASAGMVIFMLLRIAGISLIVVLALRYKFCSPVAVLVGVLAIQAGVYFEPAVRRRREKKRAALNQTHQTGDGSLSGTQEQTQNQTGDGSLSGTQEQTQSLTQVHQTENRPLSGEDDMEYDSINAQELQENLQKDAQGTEGDRGE